MCCCCINSFRRSREFMNSSQLSCGGLIDHHSAAVTSLLCETSSLFINRDCVIPYVHLSSKHSDKPFWLPLSCHGTHVKLLNPR
jgi:hypothetical protein